MKLKNPICFCLRLTTTTTTKKIYRYEKLNFNPKIVKYWSTICVAFEKFSHRENTLIIRNDKKIPLIISIALILSYYVKILDTGK